MEKICINLSPEQIKEHSAFLNKLTMTNVDIWLTGSVNKDAETNNIQINIRINNTKQP